MNILFVSDFVENVNSGAAGSLISIGEGLIALGHKVDYIWRNGNRLIKSNNYSRFLELPIIQYFQMKKALNYFEYHVVIVSQPHAWLAFKLLKNEYPNVLFINRTHGWEKRIQRLSISNDFQNSLIKKLGGWIVANLTSHCSYLTLKYCDGLIAATSSDANFIKVDCPVYSNKVFVIPYGLDGSYLQRPVPDFEYKSPEKVRFIFVGQYIGRKGIRDIVSSFGKLNSCFRNRFEITFVVNKEAVSKVKSDFDFLPNSDLNVFPWMNRNDLINLYLSHDVFLMPSYGEGFGKTTIEAMACGLCVIGYREAALSDFGEHLINSLIADLGDETQFLENIKYALSYPSKIKTFGLRAYIRVQNCTWESTSIRTIDLINKLRLDH